MTGLTAVLCAAAICAALGAAWTLTAIALVLAAAIEVALFVAAGY